MPLAAAAVNAAVDGDGDTKSLETNPVFVNVTAGDGDMATHTFGDTGVDAVSMQSTEHVYLPIEYRQIYSNPANSCLLFGWDLRYCSKSLSVSQPFE